MRLDRVYLGVLSHSDSGTQLYLVDHSDFHDRCNELGAEHGVECVTTDDVIDMMAWSRDWKDLERRWTEYLASNAASQTALRDARRETVVDAVVSLTASIPSIATHTTAAANGQQVPVYDCAGIRFQNIVHTRLSFDA